MIKRALKGGVILFFCFILFGTAKGSIKEEETKKPSIAEQLHHDKELLARYDKLSPVQKKRFLERNKSTPSFFYIKVFTLFFLVLSIASSFLFWGFAFTFRSLDKKERKILKKVPRQIHPFIKKFISSLKKELTDPWLAVGFICYLSTFISKTYLPPSFMDLTPFFGTLLQIKDLFFINSILKEEHIKSLHDLFSQIESE